MLRLQNWKKSAQNCLSSLTQLSLGDRLLKKFKQLLPNTQCFIAIATIEEDLTDFTGVNGAEVTQKVGNTCELKYDVAIELLMSMEIAACGYRER